MNPTNWDLCPREVRRQSSLVARYLYDYLNESLVGVYVHGSICLGAYAPGRSELDMLAVINRPLAADERFHLMKAFLAMHRQPAPLRASIVLWSAMEKWTHPAPYQFRFCDKWRAQYEAMEAREDMSFWQFDGPRTDRELACHVRLTRERGIAVLGPPPAGILPKVPEAHFLDQ